MRSILYHPRPASHFAATRDHYSSASICTSPHYSAPPPTTIAHPAYKSQAQYSAVTYAGLRLVTGGGEPKPALGLNPTGGPGLVAYIYIERGRAREIGMYIHMYMYIKSCTCVSNYQNVFGYIGMFGSGSGDRQIELRQSAEYIG